MQTITADVLEKAGEAIAVLNPDAIGDIHTVTLRVDKETGDCLVEVESTMHPNVILLVQDL